MSPSPTLPDYALRLLPELADTDVTALALPATHATDDGRFATAHTCSDCHSNADGASAMRDADGAPIAPWNLWSGTMMANSARDPLWRAAVSAEAATAPAAAAEIEAKCARCHAPMAHETADRTRAVGADGDPDFGPGGDTVAFDAPLSGEGPWTVTVDLLFQPLSNRWGQELLAVDTDETRAFGAMWRGVDRRPVRIGGGSATVQ